MEFDIESLTDSSHPISNKGGQGVRAMTWTQHQIAGVTVEMHKAPADGIYLITINGRYIAKATFSRSEGPKRWIPVAVSIWHATVIRWCPMRCVSMGHQGAAPEVLSEDILPTPVPFGLSV